MLRNRFLKPSLSGSVVWAILAAAMMTAAACAVAGCSVKKGKEAAEGGKAVATAAPEGGSTTAALAKPREPETDRINPNVKILRETEPLAVGAPDPGGTLRVRYEAEPAMLNNIMDGRDVYSVYIGGLIGEALVKYNKRTVTVEPQLAESWDVSPDGLAITYKLRKGVKWHDGKPFTAKDVKFTYDAMMDPKNETSKIKFAFVDAKSLTVVDDYTVKMEWKKPYFLAVGSMSDMNILPAHVYEGHDFNKHPANRAPIGTGPFVFEEWKTGDRISVKKNPGYWGTPANLDRIVFRFVVEDPVALQLFKRGEIDFIGLRPELWNQNKALYENSPDYRVYFYPLPSYAYIGWNMRRPMFADVRVRKAMTMLLDRAGIVKHVFHGMGIVPTGPSMPGSGAYDSSIAAPPFDPPGAAALLKEAGWADTDADGVLDKDGKLFEFELLVPHGLAEYDQLSAIYKEQLKKVGVTMSIRKFEWATFLKKVQKLEFDAEIAGWRHGDEDDFYQLWHSSQAQNGSNYPGLILPELDALCENYRAEYDRAKRDAMGKQIHRIIHEQQPYTFVIQRVSVVIFHKRVQNVEVFPIWTVNDPSGWWIPKSQQAGQGN